MIKGPITLDVEERPPRLTDDGKEILDNSPVAIPIRFQRRDSISEQVSMLVRGEFSRLAEKQGYETFEEADDFDVGDDYEPPASPYELDEEQVSYDHRRDARFNQSQDGTNGESPEVTEPVQPDRKGTKSSAKRATKEGKSVRKSRNTASDDGSGDGEEEE